MKRILFLLTTLCVVVSCFVFSAGAVSDKEFLDYNDYLTSVEVIGSEDIVKWSFPLNMYSGDIYNETGKFYNTIVSSNNAMTATFVNGNSYRITFYSPYLSIDNIPTSTTISAHFELNLSRGLGNDDAVLNVGASYFDADGNFIKQINGSMRSVGFESDVYVDMLVTQDIPNAVGVQIFYQFNYFKSSVVTGTSTISLVDSSFTCAISSLYRESAIANKTNKLMNEVNKQLEANGEKLDEIINGDVSSEAPAGSDKLDDFLEVEEELLDQTQDGFDQADILFNQAPGIIMLYASAFLFVSNVLEKIALAGWLQNILTISVSLGLIGFILNLTATALRNNGRGGGKQ